MGGGRPPTITGVDTRDGTAHELSSAVLAALEGNDEGFRTLYRAIQPGLLRYMKVLVGSDAEDVASETWLHVVRDLHTFRGDGEAFRRWTRDRAAQIACCIAWTRSRRRVARAGSSEPSRSRSEIFTSAASKSDGVVAFWMVWRRSSAASGRIMPAARPSSSAASTA